MELGPKYRFSIKIPETHYFNTLFVLRVPYLRLKRKNY